MPVRPLLALLTGALLVLGLLGAAPAQAADGVENTQRPRIGGEPVYGSVLRAGPGKWSPGDVTLSYQWLRDGLRIPGASERTYVPGRADLRHRLSVRVTATDGEGASGQATAARTARVRKAELVNRRRPQVVGTQRFTHTVRATPGRWSTTPDRVRYQWLRSGRPIRGATRARYRFAPQDVGRRIRVRVTAVARGHHPAAVQSARAPEVRHRVDVRRTVTYSVRTRGRITTSVGRFRRQAQQTFADPRGWRAGGVRFRPVARGGSFTLWLAEASTVPGFSWGCSSMWSCRVGRNVIVNQTRWKHASPAWNAAGRSLRDYRHMVVNHETGHWLGKGHVSCPGKGKPAPVMMQQSKGTQGCRFNPWPTTSELR